MTSSDPNPFTRYSAAPDSPPGIRWKDILFVFGFVLFIYIFVRTGGFFQSPKPTPTLLLAPTPIARALRTVTPVPTRVLLTPTPTEVVLKLANQNPSIRGTIIELYTFNGTVTGAYVRGKLEADTSVAQAFVRFTDKTRVFMNTINGPYQAANLNDLAKGDIVEILFAEPGAQSSNERPIADEILIVK